ncbi:MAG TPA: hypothetical protein VFR81_16550, partial [Longimicrobium sp.]|nr:hypothetical protein [Longimicrobium sp.]
MRHLSFALLGLVLHAPVLAAQGRDPDPIPRDTLPGQERAGGVVYADTPTIATRVSAESFSELLTAKTPALVVRRFGGA